MFLCYWTQANLEYKKKHRMMKVKLVDGSVKTLLIDDSETIQEIQNVICKKVQINNPEEYSLRVEGRNESTRTFGDCTCFGDLCCPFDTSTWSRFVGTSD
jgi:hypothetical protein